MSKELKDEHDEKYAAHVFGVFDKAAAKASKEKLIKVILLAVGKSIPKKDLEALSEEKLRNLFLVIMAKSIPRLVEERLEEKVREIVRKKKAKT